MLPAVREVTGPPERDSLCLAVDRNGRRGPEQAGREGDGGMTIEEDEEGVQGFS